MQGWRKNMEDKEISIDLTDQISLFAVFDGIFTKFSFFFNLIKTLKHYFLSIVIYI